MVLLFASDIEGYQRGFAADDKAVDTLEDDGFVGLYLLFELGADEPAETGQTSDQE